MPSYALVSKGTLSQPKDALKEWFDAPHNQGAVQIAEQKLPGLDLEEGQALQVLRVESVGMLTNRGPGRPTGTLTFD